MLLTFAKNSIRSKSPPSFRAVYHNKNHVITKTVDSIRSLNFKPLASLCSGTGWFESYLVKNHKDRFSRDVAQIISHELFISHIHPMSINLSVDKV